MSRHNSFSTNGYVDVSLESASNSAKIKATLSPGETWSSYTTKTQLA